MLSVGLELKIKELRVLCRAGEVPVGFFFRFDSDATPMLIFNIYTGRRSTTCMKCEMSGRVRSWDPVS